MVALFLRFLFSTKLFYSTPLVALIYHYTHPYFPHSEQSQTTKAFIQFKLFKLLLCQQGTMSQSTQSFLDGA